MLSDGSNATSESTLVLPQSHGGLVRISHLVFVALCSQLLAGPKDFLSTHLDRLLKNSSFNSSLSIAALYLCSSSQP